MEIKAKSTVNMSPRKVNLVASAVRNKKAGDALKVLSFMEKRAAGGIFKTVASAVANAVHNKKLSRDDLFIKSIDVTPGLAYKRFRPSTRGRVHPYKKRTTHITITLEGNPSTHSVVKEKEVLHGTKS